MIWLLPLSRPIIPSMIVDYIVEAKMRLSWRIRRNRMRNKREMEMKRREGMAVRRRSQMASRIKNIVKNRRRRCA